MRISKRVISRLFNLPYLYLLPEPFPTVIFNTYRAGGGPATPMIGGAWVSPGQTEADPFSTTTRGPDSPAEDTGEAATEKSHPEVRFTAAFSTPSDRGSRAGSLRWAGSRVGSLRRTGSRVGRSSRVAVEGRGPIRSRDGGSGRTGTLIGSRRRNRNDSAGKSSRRCLLITYHATRKKLAAVRAAPRLSRRFERGFPTWTLHRSVGWPASVSSSREAAAGRQRNSGPAVRLKRSELTS